MTTIYHNPRCSKSRDAIALLESKGIEFDVIKYLEEPPSEAELAKIIKMLKLSPEQLVRKGEKLYSELGLADQNLTDQEWIKTLAGNPKLIQRPIVVHKGKAAIGRPPESLLRILD